MYKAEQNYGEAMKNYFLALKIFEKRDDKKNIASCSNSIGDIYEAQHNYSAAMASYHAALTTLQAIGDTKGLMWPYYNIGEVNMYEGNYPAAILYIDSAIKINKAYGDKIGMAWCYNEMGLVLFRKKQYAEAVRYYKMALAIGTRSGETSSSINANKNLSMIYKATGDFEKALCYYEAYVNHRDSVNNNDERLKTAAQETKRESELKERQIKINELSILQKRNERIIFIAGIALLALSMAAIYRNYKSQKKTNSVQAQLLEQKEMLMKEIHHRVKNNLAVIGSLLDLQLSTTNDIDAKKAITESTFRVRAIALLHYQLYQYNDISSIELSGFVTDLFSQVNAVLAGQMNIVFENRIPATMLDVDTAVPLGLMINELLTNSYKYAFSEGNGNISIWLGQTGTSYMLQYKDSGPGLMHGKDLQKPKSLGMTLLKNLNKQIGGVFQFDWGKRTFIIPFKNAASMKTME